MPASALLSFGLPIGLLFGAPLDSAFGVLMRSVCGLSQGMYIIAVIQIHRDGSVGIACGFDFSIHGLT